MKNIMKLLKDKADYYDSIAQMAKKSMERHPQKGKIRVAGHKGIPQYYLVTEPGDTNGRYLTKKEIGIAREIIQSGYDKKVYTCALKWSKAIRNFIKSVPKNAINDIDVKTMGRRNLITPYELTDEEYVEQWLAVEYHGKKFDADAPEIITENGERVRSKSEKIIADKLFMMGIPYRYEYPKRLVGYGKIYPDFTILSVAKRKEIILEHFGMMDNPDYCQSAIDKINQYILSEIYPGDTLFMTYETSEKPLNTTTLTRLLEHIME